jgi:hypothetical protein
MAKQFSRSVIAAIDVAKIIGIRAGTEHKFIGVWPVVVDGRVFARSWGVSPDGWYYAFLEEANGFLHVGDREIRVRGHRPRGERIRDKVEDAYAAKFTTKASQKWVRGFRTERRRNATMEFLPR